MVLVDEMGPLLNKTWNPCDKYPILAAEDLDCLV